jgi:hypothetical protein
MTHRWLRCIVFGSWLSLVCFMSGCGPGEVRGVKLQGQVLNNGQPLKALPGERVIVTFEHLEKRAGHLPIMCAGPMQKDGTFMIEGQERKGTPPGKYSVRIHGEFSSEEGENRFEPLFPEGKSDLIAEVTGEEGQKFIIDVGTKPPTITKEPK